MKYTLKIQLKNGGEVSSEPFEFPWEPEKVKIEVAKKDLPKSIERVNDFIGWRCDFDGTPAFFKDYSVRKCYTKEQALSVDAYMQLTQAMKAYNGDWTPDWDDEDQKKHVIQRFMNGPVASSAFLEYYFLAFPTAELRDEFLINFHDLIKIFYQI